MKQSRSVDFARAAGAELTLRSGPNNQFVPTSFLQAIGFSKANKAVPMDIDYVPVVKPVKKGPSPLEIPELLLHIFSFLESSQVADHTMPLDFVKVDSIKYSITTPKLHACVRVSKLWNKCAMQMLWKNVKIGNESGVLRIVQTLEGGSKQWKSLKTQDCWGVEPLDCNQHIGFRVVPSIANNWVYGHLIKSLSLMPAHGVQIEQFKKWDLDQVLIAVALNCPQLEDLVLSNCSQVTDKSMVQIARHCSQLKRLNLNRCDQVSTKTLVELSKNCTQLIQLNLSRPLMNTQSELSDASLVDLITKNQNLQELRLRNCELLSDSSVIAICQAVGKNLYTLDLSWCAKLTDKAIVNGVAKYCPKLKSLALNGCKKLEDQSLHALLSYCPQISSLSLAHLPFITDTVLTNMAERLKHLVILSLNGCANVKDSSIIALAQNCTELQSLSLFSLSITDAAVQSITLNCQNLISLSVSGCTQVTDGGAVSIQRLKNLQSLYLNGSVISDISVVAIAKSCPKLRALSLNDCTALTDFSFVCLAQYCQSIQSISMNSCKISAVGVKALVQHCIDLREISVKGCNYCVLYGEGAQKLIVGNGGMHGMQAVGIQVAAIIKARRITLVK